MNLLEVDQPYAHGHAHSMTKADTNRSSLTQSAMGLREAGRDEGCILTWDVHTYTTKYSHTHPDRMPPTSNMEMRHWYKPSLGSLWRYCFVVVFSKGLGLCGWCYCVCKMYGGRGRDSRKDKHFFGGGQSVAALDEVLWWKDSVLSDICDTEGQKDYGPLLVIRAFGQWDYHPGSEDLGPLSFSAARFLISCVGWESRGEGGSLESGLLSGFTYSSEIRAMFSFFHFSLFFFLCLAYTCRTCWDVLFYCSVHF